MEQTNNDKVYISNEISTYMTNNKLLALSDRLNLTTPVDYACIHAKGDTSADGRRVYSTIGILASDFSKGKGDMNIKAEANISPAEARYIFQRVQMGLCMLDAVIFSSEKIFGTPDANGYAPVRKLTIGRASKDKDGKERKSPWYVIAENGVGIKANNANGGAYCQSGSYKCERKVLVYLTDQDFYCLLAQVVSYINIWEMTYGAKLIREGRAALETAKAEHTAVQSENQQNQPPVNNAGNANNATSHQANNNSAPGANNNAVPQTPPNNASANQTPQHNTTIMSLDQARAVLIDIGKHKGKTLGQLETEWPNGISWYINSYHGDNESLRNGANIIMTHIAQKKSA